MFSVLGLRFSSELFRCVGLELVRGLTKSGALITFTLDRLQAESAYRGITGRSNAELCSRS